MQSKSNNFDILSRYVKQKLSKLRHEKFTIPPVKINELFDELNKLSINN